MIPGEVHCNCIWSAWAPVSQLCHWLENSRLLLHDALQALMLSWCIKAFIRGASSGICTAAPRGHWADISSAIMGPTLYTIASGEVRRCRLHNSALENPGLVTEWEEKCMQRCCRAGFFSSPLLASLCMTPSPLLAPLHDPFSPVATLQDHHPPHPPMLVHMFKSRL